MFTLKVENSNGYVLTLTQNESEYQIVDIDGLNPPKAIINSSLAAGADGSRFNSSKLEERNVVITIGINGNVEANRINLYRFFKTKQKCKIYYKNGLRDVYVEGYVDNIDCNLFTMSQIMQISIVCNNPYFQSLQEIADDISKVVKMFSFPFSIGGKDATYNPNNTDDSIEFSNYDYGRITKVINESETEVGIIIEITFDARVDNPVIRNTTTGEEFRINGEFYQGDRIIINTNKGYKQVKLYHSGIESDIFTSVPITSTWFQLQIGVNNFTYYASRNDGFIRVVFKHYNQYEGV